MILKRENASYYILTRDKIVNTTFNTCEGKNSLKISNQAADSSIRPSKLLIFDSYKWCFKDWKTNMKSECARALSKLLVSIQKVRAYLCVWYIIWNLLSESFGVSYICFMWSKTIFVTTIWSFDNLVLVICNFFALKIAQYYSNK